MSNHVIQSADLTGPEILSFYGDDDAAHEAALAYFCQPMTDDESIPLPPPRNG